MTTETEKQANEYLHSDEVTKTSMDLQSEAVKDDEGGVFVVHNIKIQFIEKLDYKTEKPAWTEKEREDINALTTPLHDRVRVFVANELRNNNKLGLMELKSGNGDFKSEYAIDSAGVLLRELLGLKK